MTNLEEKKQQKRLLEMWVDCKDLRLGEQRWRRDGATENVNGAEIEDQQGFQKETDTASKRRDTRFRGNWKVERGLGFGEKN